MRAQLLLRPFDPYLDANVRARSCYFGLLDVANAAGDAAAARRVSDLIRCETAAPRDGVKTIRCEAAAPRAPRPGPAAAASGRTSHVPEPDVTWDVTLSRVRIGAVRTGAASATIAGRGSFVWPF